MTRDKFERAQTPPPALFWNDAERNFAKQIADEVAETVIGQRLAYYPIDVQASNFHPLYGEAINKVFHPPVFIYAFVEWNDHEVKTTLEGIDRSPKEIVVHFHKRRLAEDMDLYVQEGDFVAYGVDFYEIVAATEPKEIFGQTDHKVEISAICKKCRRGLFETFEVRS